jgi:hypothetical protein
MVWYVWLLWYFMITAISAPSGLFCFPKPFNAISKTHGSTWTFPFPHQRNEPDGQTPWENCGRAAAANLHLFRVFSLDSPSGKMWQHAHYIPFKYLEKCGDIPIITHYIYINIYISHCDSGFYCTYFCPWIHWYLEGPFACRGLYSPEEERDFIRDHLGPELEKSGFWDQQKDEPPPW